MSFVILSAMFCYFCVLFFISYQCFQKNISSTEFMIGNRSLNYWLTALAAHASDMSSWLFLGYPALIFSQGLFGFWVALGLLICMYINWELIAPKIRTATERYHCFTFSSFFESRFQDNSGVIRLFSAFMLMIFYTVYLSAFLTGLGELLSSLFPLQYLTAIYISLLLVVPYVFIGGYRMLAWLDLFQGCFLLIMIIFIPLYVLHTNLGWSVLSQTLTVKGLQHSLFPDFSHTTFLSIVSMAFGWGLGYFGQPHIVTKFMGINNVKEISKSKWIGMTWMTLSLFAATLVGVVAVFFFQNQQINPEKVFIEMVHRSFHPFVVGLILCAVIGATVNAMSSQILVMASSLTEDFYKPLLRPRASSKELLYVSRIGIILCAFIALLIACQKNHTIYSLVQYAWSGIGSSFGPLIFLSLYSKQINKYGAWAGILCGGLTAALWPYINTFFEPQLAPMLPGITIGLLTIIGISHLTKNKSR